MGVSNKCISGRGRSQFFLFFAG